MEHENLSRENPDFSALNELGCADELASRLTKLQGILGALSAASENLSPAITTATLWCANDLVEECIAIKNRTVQLLPRVEG